MKKEEIIEKIKEIKEENPNLTDPKKENHTLKKITSGEKRYKVIYERDLCIGAVACVMASTKYWELDDEGKAILIGGKEVSEGIFETEIPEEDYEEMFEAAKGCPVVCIHIIDKKTGEKII